MTKKGFSQDAMRIQKLYAAHLKELQRAKSRLNLEPPKMLTNTFMRVEKVRQDYIALKRIITDNIALLKRINRIQRTKGFTQNFNTKGSIDRSRIKSSNFDLQKIQRDNFLIGCRLLKVKSDMNTVRDVERLHNQKKRETNPVPCETLKKYKIIVLPQDVPYLRQLLRPKIFFDLEVENIRPLGRIIIQLFTEACPDLVLEFVRMCATSSCQIFKFIRIFPNLWVEGELYATNQMLSNPDYEHDMHAIDHGVRSGILSFSKTYLNGFPPGILNFAISFRPLPVLKGERIPFGVITGGQKVLNCLDDYGTKLGKMQKNIVVSNCGLWK